MAQKTYLRVCNWKKYQHYAHRAPPWIKLHRDLLTSEMWVTGTDASRVLALACMLLAASTDNKIPAESAYLRRVGYLNGNPDWEPLVAAQFLEVVDENGTVLPMADNIPPMAEIENPPVGGNTQHDVSIDSQSHEVVDENLSASTLLARSESVVLRVEESREETEESRGEKSYLADSGNPPTGGNGIHHGTKRKVVPRETSPDWFLDFKLAYPRRAGDYKWRGGLHAANARLAEGHTTEEFIEGAKRYAAFVRACGKEGTEYVKQAPTFLGREKAFLEPWGAPPTRAELQRDSNLAASEEWLRQQEVADARQ